MVESARSDLSRCAQVLDFNGCRGSLPLTRSKGRGDHSRGFVEKGESFSMGERTENQDRRPTVSILDIRPEVERRLTSA